MFLVTGATGDLGRSIVQQLCDQEIPVRAFARLTSRYTQLDNRGAQIFIGDLMEKRDIEKACQGVQYIISTHSNPNDSLGVDYRSNIDLIDIAKANNIQHFVFISVLGTDRGYEDSPIFKAKREVEKYLESSGLNYTILRPSALASSLLPLAERFKKTGLYLLIGDAKNRTSVVSNDDVARIAIDSVFIEAANQKIIPVGGPEILARQDIYQIFSHVFNREPIVINPPLFLFDGLRGGLGLINADLYQKLGTLRVLLGNEFFCTAEEIQNLEQLFSIKLESLESYIRRYLGS